MCLAVFTAEEFKDRLNRTKQKMSEEGVEVLLVTNPSNMYYLSGYNAWSFYVHQMLIVMIDEPQPIWLGRQMDANSAKVTTWLDHDNIIPYPDDYVQSEIKHPMQFTANILKEIGQAKRVIGLEMETHFFSAQSYMKFTEALPNAAFKDASKLVNWVRIIKSDREIEYMRRAAQIVEQAMQRGYDTIDVGVRECDAAAEIYHAQVSGTPQFGGDYPSIVPMMPSGEQTSSPHLTWTDKRYKPNDPVIIEIAGCYKRYHAPLARTMVLGAPSQHLLDASQAVQEALHQTLASIKPGMTAEEIEYKWSVFIKKRGYYKSSRLGYSIGASYPPDWGEHTVSIRPGDKTVIKPNMTFHLIPGFWFDDWGVEISESIRITENGCERLANFPQDLYVKTNPPRYNIL
ncbi:M24 family metallopeptidase [Bacillus tianshenii]|nr:M24 family metallopeptidase [Bacillus tianshenii]